MGLSSIAAIALQGLREQAENLEATAGDIANADSGEYTSPGIDPSEAETLDLTESELNYRANAAVFEAGADLWDILGMVTRD
jgi:flagellar basal-body rod protein FlgC